MTNLFLKFDRNSQVLFNCVKPKITLTQYDDLITKVFWCHTNSKHFTMKIFRGKANIYVYIFFKQILSYETRYLQFTSTSFHCCLTQKKLLSLFCKISHNILYFLRMLHHPRHAGLRISFPNIMFHSNLCFSMKHTSF